MMLLCILISIVSLNVVSFAAPTENSLYYVVTEELQFYDSEINEEEREYIGKPCNHTCGENLANVICDKYTKTCQCSPEFPVKLSKKNSGCVKPSLLEQQCMYSESCAFSDPFSSCVQVSHNAYCQCNDGYHIVTAQRSSKRAFCSKDILQIAKDLPTLLLVIAGVAVFSTLICFVLKLFVGKSHRYENSTITTRLLSTSEIAQVARSFRQSNHDTTFSRRGSRGVTVSSSRATAARAAAILLVSCHIPARDQATRKSSDSQVGSGSVLLLQNSNPNSPRSFSAKQFQRDSEQKLAAKNRVIFNQPSTSSLGSFSSPKRSMQKRPQSSSLNNLNDKDNLHIGMEKPSHYSVGDEINDTKDQR